MDRTKASKLFCPPSKDNMIILDSEQKINDKFILSYKNRHNDINSSYFQKIIQSFYDRSVRRLDLSSISCPCCSSSDWTYHAYYTRALRLHFGIKVKIRITRVICKSCGKTHAILIGDIIPFSSYLYSFILELINSFNSYSFFEARYHKYKFLHLSDFSYSSICIAVSRASRILFITTWLFLSCISSYAIIWMYTKY